MHARVRHRIAHISPLDSNSFIVEHPVRGKWMYKCCETITQAPMAPHVIDKGLPTTGSLSRVLVTKYLDHLALYRPEGIFERFRRRSLWTCSERCLRTSSEAPIKSLSRPFDVLWILQRKPLPSPPWLQVYRTGSEDLSVLSAAVSNSSRERTVTLR